MRHENHFNYDGKWSYDMGIIKAGVSGGLFEDQIISNKTIIEEKISGRNIPYFYGVERDPLSFPLPIYFDENLSVDKIREIMQWLDVDTYKPFYMVDNPERLWYAMPIDDINVIHNGINSGYMELTLRTDDTSALTPYALSQVYKFRDNADGKIITFENNGDFDIKPIVHIVKVGSGNIIIQNLSNDTGNFTFADLQDTEKLYIDCENKEILTDFFTHRYNNFNGNYLNFVRGINRLKVIGDCDLIFETESKIY